MKVSTKRRNKEEHPVYTPPADSIGPQRGSAVNEARLILKIEMSKTDPKAIAMLQEFLRRRISFTGNIDGVSFRVDYSDATISM